MLSECTKFALFCFSFSFSRGNAYEYLSATTYTWYEAEAACQSTYGTTLATITSATENSAAVALGSPCFIGLNEITTTGNWYWSGVNSVYNATPITNYNYTNWKVGEPNNSGGEPCTELYATGKWNDLSCTERYRCAICNAATPQPTTVNPTTAEPTTADPTTTLEPSPKPSKRTDSPTSESSANETDTEILAECYASCCSLSSSTSNVQSWNANFDNDNDNGHHWPVVASPNPVSPLVGSLIAIGGISMIITDFQAVILGLVWVIVACLVACVTAWKMKLNANAGNGNYTSVIKYDTDTGTDTDTVSE